MCFSPDQAASMAQALISTRPIGNASSRTVSSVMSFATPDAFFGHDTRITPLAIAPTVRQVHARASWHDRRTHGDIEGSARPDQVEACGLGANQRRMVARGVAHLQAPIRHESEILPGDLARVTGPLGGGLSRS
jgi:hypothetical protein